MIKTLLIKENIDLLQRFLNVIEVLGDSQYVSSDSSLFDSSIGAHARHVLDHYQAFIDGLERGHINYDDRARDPVLEVDRVAVIQQFKYLMGELEQVQDVDRSIQVTMDIVSTTTTIESTQQQSSIARELTFLHSHTTHHQALVGFIMRVLNIAPLPAEIGLAPATIRHREAVRCAR